MSRLRHPVTNSLTLIRPQSLTVGRKTKNTKPNQNFVVKLEKSCITLDLQGATINTLVLKLYMRSLEYQKIYNFPQNGVQVQHSQTFLSKFSNTFLVRMFSFTSDHHTLQFLQGQTCHGCRGLLLCHD